MARLSIESRMRVITLRSRGYSILQIRKRLQEENIIVSRQAIYSLVKKFQNYRVCSDLPRKRRQQKITAEMRLVIEEALTSNDEITSRGIRSLLTSQWPEFQVSIPTIKRVRKNMGWVCTRPHYCQLLRPVSWTFECVCYCHVLYSILCF